MNLTYKTAVLIISFWLTNTHFATAQCGTINGLPTVVNIGSSGTYTPSPTVTVGSTYVLSDTFWNASPGIINPQIINPTLTGAGTYVLNVMAIDTQNKIVNGDFSAGNTGFTSQYIPGTGGTWGLLSNPGEYAVTTNPSLVHVNFTSMGDHTTGTGQMMVVNGASTPNTDLWCQSVTVTANTDYYFSLWASSVVAGSPGIINFKVNGSVVGAQFSVNPTVGTWTQYFTTWNSGASTTANLCLTNQNTAGSGNDFAIDDIFFSDMCKLTSSIQLVSQNFNYTISPTCVKDTFHFNATSIVNNDSIVWTFGDNTTGYGPNPTHFYATNGNYTVTMKVYYNGLMTSTSKTITFTQSGYFPDLAAIVKDVTCFGEANGSVQLIINNLSGGESTSIDTFAYVSGKMLYAGLAAGTYVFHVKNTFGCITDTTITIVQPSELSISPSIKNVSCNGKNDGEVILTITNGTAPYKINGTAVISPHTYSNMFPGTYPFRISDKNNCRRDTMLTITQPTTLKLTIDSVYYPLCFNTSSGAIRLSAWGGTQAYTYYIDNANKGNDPLMTGLSSKMYNLAVADNNGCYTDLNYFLKQYCCQPLIPNAFSPNNDDKNNTFKIMNMQDFDYIDMKIYNRWGEIVFRGFKEKAIWDGIYNGQDVDMGVYFYEIMVRCDVGKEKVLFKGEVTLVR